MGEHPSPEGTASWAASTRGPIENVVLFSYLFFKENSLEIWTKFKYEQFRIKNNYEIWTISNSNKFQIRANFESEQISSWNNFKFGQISKSKHYSKSKTFFEI